MKPALFVTALLLLTACDAGAEDRRRTMESAEDAAQTVSHEPALVADGAAEPVAADPDETLQMSASVVRVDYLENQGDQNTIKLFGTAGGDPAMNGLYTYITFFEGADTGWKTFRIGDILDYRILAEAPGRVDLEITESRLNPANDEISSRVRRVILRWPVAEDEGAPEAVSITPAR